jgi:hypothetical protein
MEITGLGVLETTIVDERGLISPVFVCCLFNFN